MARPIDSQNKKTKNKKSKEENLPNNGLCRQDRPQSKTEKKKREER